MIFSWFVNWNIKCSKQQLYYYFNSIINWLCYVLSKKWKDIVLAHILLKTHACGLRICGVYVVYLFSCFVVVVLLFVFTFWVPCCGVPYNFCIKHMFCLSGTSIILAYSRKGSVLYRLTLQLELKFEIFESIFTKSRQSIIIRTLLMKHL